MIGVPDTYIEIEIIDIKLIIYILNFYQINWFG